MDHDEDQTRVADLSMEIDHPVCAEGLREGLDSGHESKFDPHQGQAHETKGDREVGPESLARLVGAHQCEGQGRYADPHEDPEPGDPTHHRGHGGVVSGLVRLTANRALPAAWHPHYGWTRPS